MRAEPDEWRRLATDKVFIRNGVSQSTDKEISETLSVGAEQADVRSRRQQQTAGAAVGKSAKGPEADLASYGSYPSLLDLACGPLVGSGSKQSG